MKLDRSDSVYDRWDADIVAIIALIVGYILAMIVLNKLMPGPDIVWVISFFVGTAIGITPYFVHLEWEHRRWMNKWDR